MDRGLPGPRHYLLHEGPDERLRHRKPALQQKLAPLRSIRGNPLNASPPPPPPELPPAESVVGQPHDEHGETDSTALHPFPSVRVRVLPTDV